MRLRGKLRLAEEALFIKEERVRHLALRVGNVTFTYRDMESCATGLTFHADLSDESDLSDRVNGQTLICPLEQAIAMDYSSPLI
jgi:hypothetical protein